MHNTGDDRAGGQSFRDLGARNRDGGDGALSLGYSDRLAGAGRAIAPPRCLTVSPGSSTTILVTVALRMVASSLEARGQS